MFRDRFGWAGPVLGILLGLGLLAHGDNAAAQYEGADFCKVCHGPEYASWKGHGHAWMQLHTGGAEPADFPAPVVEFFTQYPDIPVPDINEYAGGSITWGDVEDIFGHFRDGEGYLLLTNGKRATNYSPNQSSMPARCNKCHNTGFDPGGHAYSTPSFETGIEGSWALNGISCEQCHGPGFDSMEVPSSDICRDCHSAGDFGTELGSDPALVGFRIPIDPTADLFTNHHGEGDETRRSPHKDVGCTACHDPHKSVWKKEGGVLYADPNSEESIGMMCTECHTKTRIRGTMGEIGMVCTDCHMPESSASGHRHAHLFRINTEVLSSDDNWKEELNDSGSLRKYWMNFDGTTGAGDSFITVDMACADCHTNMDLTQLANAAKYIHRQAGLVDLTINGGDDLQRVKKAANVSVDFSVYPEEVAGGDGMLANWYVFVQTPRGLFYWNGKAWRSGLRAWRKQAPISEMSRNVLNATLKNGHYTFWTYLVTADDDHVDSVPLFVSRR